MDKCCHVTLLRLLILFSRKNYFMMDGHLLLKIRQARFWIIRMRCKLIFLSYRKKFRIQHNTEKMFQQAFSGSEDTVINNGSILKAISAYESSLVGMNSRFDKTIRGEEEALAENEKQGFNIFMGRQNAGLVIFTTLQRNSTTTFYWIKNGSPCVPSTADLSHPKRRWSWRGKKLFRCRNISVHLKLPESM